MHLIGLDIVSPTSNPQSDNNPLTYVLTTAKLDAKGQRWVAALSGYKFSINHRSGKKNADTMGFHAASIPRKKRPSFLTCLRPYRILCQ